MLVLFLWLPGISPAGVPERVLFIGNSFTFYNNGLQNHFRKLIASASADGKAPGNARIMTISGGHLPEHSGGVPVILASQDWDVVVMQGYSSGPVTEKAAGPFRGAARDYAAQIRAASARPEFFMSWA